MAALDNIYDFYSVWSQDQRIEAVLEGGLLNDSYIAIAFPENEERGYYPNYHYNYGHSIGLLYIGSWDWRFFRKYSEDSWGFQVGVFNPDDEDIDWAVYKPDPYLFDEVKEFCKSMPRFYTDYRDALSYIQAHFLCGKIY